MAEIIRKDESVLTNQDRGVLSRTLEKLEQFFPEHKVYAMDSLCAQQRENSVKLAKKLGYDSVDLFLLAYGFESIKGPAVYAIRKDCGIKPGEEPILIKERIDNALNNLNEYYPSHVIEGAIQKDHKALAKNLAGFWQWLGYKSMEDMLSAYGFEYKAKAGRKATVDPDAVIAELRKRYPNGTDLKAGDIKDANPDLPIKSVMNQSKELFGMTFAHYLAEQGIIIKETKKSAEEITEEKYASYKESLREYDTLIQTEMLGWKLLPTDVSELMSDMSGIVSRKRYHNAMKEFALDEDAHIRELGVLADESTDNELRKLIRYIDFATLYSSIRRNDEQ